MALPHAYPAANPARYEEVLDKLCEALREGQTRRSAAAYAQIDHATLYRWAEKSRDVCDRIARAEMEARGKIERQMFTDALSSSTPLRDKLAYARQAPSMKHDWSDIQAQALARALSDDQIREVLGAGQSEEFPSAQELLALPKPENET